MRGEILQQQLPSAPEMEKKVLGTIMTYQHAFGHVSHILYEECFFDSSNRLVFQACKQLFMESKEIDIMTVYDKLSKNKKGVTAHYVASLTSSPGTDYALEEHCRILVQLHFSRETIIRSQRSINRLFEGDDVFDVIDDLSSGISDFTGKLIIDTPVSISKLVSQWDKKSIESKNGLTGVDTGFKELNRTIGGWQPTDLIILAARPGMGKTSFVLHQTIEAAKSGENVLFFSLEMASEQLVQKMISLKSEIDLKRIRQKKIYDNEVQKYADACDYISNLPIFIDDNSKANTFTIKSKLMRLNRDHGKIGLIIIDFLQLIGNDRNGKSENRNEQLDRITRELKALAKEFNVPIIALSQLSRSVESRGGKKIPMLSDLRESGGIEQNADIVCFIHRPEYYGETEDEIGNSTIGKAFLIIAKHRNGDLRDIQLGWEGRFTKFYEIENSDFVPESLNSLSKLMPSTDFDGENPF